MIDTEYACPDCQSDLEFVDGDFGTGVFAPDGTEQMAHEQGYLCPTCRHVWSIKDLLLAETKDLPDSEPEVDALKRWLS